MPRFTDNVPNSTFSFSQVDLNQLGAAEYTLVDIQIDASGSVSGFGSDMEKFIGTVVEACRKSPRSDNLLLRVSKFNGRLQEIHGFKLLQDCNPADYINTLRPSGSTALYDATHNGIQAVVEQGRILSQNDFLANGIVFIVTDGENNGSAVGVNTIQQAIAASVQGETLESLQTILIGVNSGGTLTRYLDDFKTQAGLGAFHAMQGATSQDLARLANFVSKSISSQSQALGTGSASVALTF